MREKMEIDFLRRSYERDINGLLVISISDMTIINKNFSQKAIDFIIKDDTATMQDQIKNFDYMVTDGKTRDKMRTYDSLPEL